MQALLKRVKAGEPVEFSDTLAVIEAHYHYHPTAFAIGAGAGATRNAAGENQGSCRVLAFARLHALSEAETLALFGHHYRDEVLNDPAGTGHANIRAFVRFGWEGVSFEGPALEPRI